ncbi:MAG: ATP-binding cassette domain-containing protein [Candidatus Heimdallarchaeota archaeon]|nr:ATP-binding cassette domain-containing protein [Candidatus Heimdallarchaeota archaeon]
MSETDSLMYARGIFSIYKGKGGSANVVALKGINLDIERGEFIAIVGPSGSGKSTLMRCLGGLQHPSAGAVFIDGQDITKLDEDNLVPFRREKIGFIFQEGNLLESISGYQNVVRTLRYSGNSYSFSRKRANEVLASLGMTSRMHSLPRRLSGGERQRVSIARALANGPSLIIADEPTGNLDYENTDNVMGLFRDLHSDINTSFLMVTHSQHVATYADRSVELRDGRFTSQHTEIDVDDLIASREVIIGDDGTLTLPPEMLALLSQYGKLWSFSANFDDDHPKIVAVPASSSAEIGKCPVCGDPVTPDMALCKNCGAQLRI